VPFTLAQCAEATVEGNTSVERFAAVVLFENDASWHFLPIAPQIEERGGLVFSTFDAAKQRETEENNPTRPPGVTAGVLGWFDFGIFVPIAGQREWRVPIYIPGISCFRVFQVVHWHLTQYDNTPLSEGLLWSFVREAFPRLERRRFDETLALYTSSSELVYSAGAFRLEEEEEDEEQDQRSRQRRAKRRSHTRSL
jgi:hypothetical protein